MALLREHAELHGHFPVWVAGPVQELFTWFETHNFPGKIAFWAATYMMKEVKDNIENFGASVHDAASLQTYVEDRFNKVRQKLIHGSKCRYVNERIRKQLPQYKSMSMLTYNDIWPHIDGHRLAMLRGIGKYRAQIDSVAATANKRSLFQFVQDVFLGFHYKHSLVYIPDPCCPPGSSPGIVYMV
jgi:hypothetical protein